MSTGVLYTPTFWKDALERAIKTAAQSVLAYLGVAGLFDAVGADWAQAGSFALGGFILSLLFSLVSGPLGSVKGSPSLVDIGPEAQGG